MTLIIDWREGLLKDHMANFKLDIVIYRRTQITAYCVTLIMLFPSAQNMLANIFCDAPPNYVMRSSRSNEKSVFHISLTVYPSSRAKLARLVRPPLTEKDKLIIRNLADVKIIRNHFLWRDDAWTATSARHAVDYYPTDTTIHRPYGKRKVEVFPRRIRYQLSAIDDDTNGRVMEIQRQPLEGARSDA